MPPVPEIALLDRVHIDNDPTIEAVVTCIACYVDHVTYQVSWFANGEMRDGWLPAQRLTVVVQEAEETYEKLKPSNTIPDHILNGTSSN